MALRLAPSEFFLVGFGRSPSPVQFILVFSDHAVVRPGDAIPLANREVADQGRNRRAVSRPNYIEDSGQVIQ
jgi:hypothetical protein